jgi:cytochrome c oxidase assembly protein subunit 15
MVSSGLADRVYVAPERLMLHLGLAFALLGALVWTALDAWAGQARQTLPGGWGARALWFTGLIYFQVLLGALVAGNHAGLVYNDFPMFNGRAWPADYAGSGLWATLAHSQGAVQAHHRLIAYLAFFATLALAATAWRSHKLADGAKQLALIVAGAVVLQVVLGIATLMAAVPLALGMIHQLMAAVVFSLAVAFAWRVRRI